jgi:hypothetical protein
MAAPLIKTPNVPLIPTFDFNDVADGTGVVVNYLYAGRDKANQAVFKIGRETPLSEQIQIDGNTTRDYFTGIINSPRILSGTVIFSFGTKADAATTITLKLYHVRGVTNTQIGSTANLINGGNYTTINHIMDDVPTTKLMIGDQLRIEIVTNGTGMHYGIDPQNSDGANITPSSAVQQTQFTVRLPFKIRQ